MAKASLPGVTLFEVKIRPLLVISGIKLAGILVQII